MEYNEDHIALAAEYALGTLDADERAQVEVLMATDSAFAAMVQAWEFRLGVLNKMVGSVEPPPELWERIRLARLLMFLDERCGGFSLPASHGGPPIDCADAPIAEQGGQ